MNEKDVYGAMMGLVVGDALGVPVEFERREDLRRAPVDGMRGGGTYGQRSGTWSDDSSMALCLMESLGQGVDYGHQMAQYLRWADEGYMTPFGEVFDMGVATRKALQRYLQGVPPLECGGDGLQDNGNGALMRVMPLALYLRAAYGRDFGEKKKAYHIIHNASRLTHAHPISFLACGLYCAVVNELLEGGTKEACVKKGLERARTFYQTTRYAAWLKEFGRVEVQTLQGLPEEDIQSTGYVVSTLEAALWCFLATERLEDCLLRAVNLGEDTDTVAAVAGGLAGLWYGADSIPPRWLSVIARRDDIRAYCKAFADSLPKGKL